MSFNNSSNTNMDLSLDDPLFWRRPTPLDCTTVRVIGIFLCLAAFAGILLNGSLLISFARHKALRTPPNIFIIFIASVGFFASCTNVPLAGSSSVFCYWLFNHVGCQLEGLVAFLYGCSSCYLLCTVSLSRCYIVVKPFNAKNVTVLKCIIISCIAVLIALLWTIFPLIGWNEYTLESSRTSCCTNLSDRRRLYVSFNLVIFVFVYCVPLIILITTNTIIYVGLKRMRDKIAHGVKIELSQKRIDMERRILRSIIMTIIGFVFTWTPYAITFFITAFSGNGNDESPMATFICACLAKTSVMWIPLLYIGTSTQFRFSLVNSSALDKLGATNTVLVRGEAANVTVAVVRQTERPPPSPIPTNNASSDKDE